MTAPLIDHLPDSWRGAALLGSAILLTLWPGNSSVPRDSHLQAVLARDFISVHTRNTPTTYYEGRRGPTGFEYELMKRFAD
ncbi:MAG TPA: lytic transglycosylase F, partial [Halomonas sp.]|nr:lytic transglycosylase F [Halomonas sp.]